MVIEGKEKHAVATDSNECLSDVVDLEYWAPKVTLDIIGLAALGQDFNTLQHSDDELARLYEQMMKPKPEQVALIVLNASLPQWLVKVLPWSVDRHFEGLTRDLRQICRQFVQERRQQIESGGGVEGGSIDLLARLIELNEFSDGELVDQLLTFLAAG